MRARAKRCQPDTARPIWEPDVATIKSGMYLLNSYGEKSPPCVVSLVKGQESRGYSMHG